MIYFNSEGAVIRAAGPKLTSNVESIRVYIPGKGWDPYYDLADIWDKGTPISEKEAQELIKNQDSR